MCSIPYSLLTKSESNILSQSLIQEHQNFCKLFNKVQTSYERKNEDNKNILDSNSPDKNKTKENQLKVWNWFKNLTLEEKIKICTIKNKWLLKIIVQLYFIYSIDNKSTISPINDMDILFSNQKNYQNIAGFLYKNIHIIHNYNDRKNYLGYNEDDYYKFYFNIKESDFSQKRKKMDEKQIQLEKKLLENIILLALEDDSLDTISISLDLLRDLKSLKKILKFFSNKECFNDWLIPFNYNNFYNFTYPSWMHNNNNLTLCQILSGIIEQQILISYEYFFYCKKIYEFPGIKIILDIYKDNENLEKFLKNNYLYPGKASSNENKENVISLNVVMDVVNKIKNDHNYKKKYDNFKKMCDQLFNDYYKSQFYNGNKLLSEASEGVFKELIYEMGKEQGKEIYLLLNKITFIKLEDAKNYRELIYIFLRKHFIDLRNKIFINELLSEKKSGRKKKKKRKNKNKNNDPLNIISNEDILNEKINKKNLNEKDILSDSNNNLINKNIIKNEENNDNINNGNISSSSNDKDEEIEGVKIEVEKNEDIFTNLEQSKKNENENAMKENLKETKRNRKFFLFPLNNKKQKNKNKNNNIKKNCIEEKIINKKEEEFSCSEKNLNEELNQIEINNQEETNLKFEKNDVNNENIEINNDENKSVTKDEEKEITNNSNNKKEDDEASIESSLTKKKLEFSKISAISIQMINEPKTNNDNSEKNILIEKQNQIEINKFYQLQQTKTSFSYQPESKNENLDNKNPVNMTINIINNQYIYQQYPFFNMQYLYYYHTPSDFFFDLLTKDINNYNDYTCKNIEYLNQIRSKYLNKVENLLKNGLEKKYKIKFEHYGSYFTNLSIEGSDLDILVFYKPNNPNFDFLNDIIDLLNENEDEFEFIHPILSASVPVIKLQINISKEIDNNIVQFLPYFEIKDISHVKIDLTFTSDEDEFKRPNQIVSYMNQNIKDFSSIKPLLLVLKRYFRVMKMNKSFTGGLSSFSLFLLILAFLKSNNLISSPSVPLGKYLYYILEKYSFFDYNNYGIDVEGPDFYFPLNKYSNNINVNNSINLFNDYEINIPEINILDPFTKLNVAKSSFQIDAIKNTFNKALFFLKGEAWKFDSSNYHNINNFSVDKNCIGNTNATNSSYDYKENDFIIIKKLFDIK